MVGYRESNFFQEMAFNRIVYGFLLITLQLVLAANRLPHPSTNFFVTSSQLLLFSGLAQYFLASNSEGEIPGCLSQNLWNVGAMIQGATWRLNPKTKKSLFMKGICVLFWPVVVIFALAFGMLQLPLILVELGWGLIKRSSLEPVRS